MPASNLRPHEEQELKEYQEIYRRLLANYMRRISTGESSSSHGGLSRGFDDRKQIYKELSDFRDRINNLIRIRDGYLTNDNMIPLDFSK